MVEKCPGFLYPKIKQTTVTALFEIPFLKICSYPSDFEK